MIWRGMFAPDVSPDVAQECRFESVIAKPHFARLLSGRPDLNRTSPTRIMGEISGCGKNTCNSISSGVDPPPLRSMDFAADSRGVGSEIEFLADGEEPAPAPRLHLSRLPRERRAHVPNRRGWPRRPLLKCAVLRHDRRRCRAPRPQVAPLP